MKFHPVQHAEAKRGGEDTPRLLSEKGLKDIKKSFGVSRHMLHLKNLTELLLYEN